MISRGQRRDRLDLVGRRLEQQLVVHLQQHAALEMPRSAGRVASRTMAILIMSLAVPCTGAFIAMRSAALRATGLLERRSGR